MRTSHYRYLARQVQQQTAGLLMDQLRPPDYSKRCTAWVLLGCLVLAAAARISLAAAAALRSLCPSRETLRKALLATLPDYHSLLHRLPTLLQSSLPRGLRKHHRRYPIAIDLHNVPYYKRHRPPPEHVRKGQRVAGTRYSHQYATASLLRKGQYYVVALTPYDPDDDLADLVRRLLRQAAHIGFSPRYVLLDRSFWTAAVLRYLQHARYPFLLPVQARGRKPTAPGGPTSTRKFFHGCATGQYRYTLKDPRRHLTATVTIVVLRRNQAGRRGRHGRYAWVYGLWRMPLSALVWIRQSYRRRFRIESSYRMLEEARGRTSSREEGWRLWYMVLAALLLNVWLDLRRQGAARQGRAAKEWYWWNRLLIAMIVRMLREPAAADYHTAGTDQPQRE